MRLPVAVRAGEGDGAHVGVGAQRLAGLLAVAVHDVEHARRQPGLGAPARRSARSISGDSSLIFSTAVLPKARQGAIFQVPVMNGTFHGLISAHTPTGWNSV